MRLLRLVMELDSHLEQAVKGTFGAIAAMPGFMPTTGDLQERQQQISVGMEQVRRGRRS